MSDELLTAIKRIEPAGDFVFTSLEGRPVKNHILARELHRFQRQVGLAINWGLRDLRVSYGVNFLRGGGAIKDLQKIMGHISFHNTEEIYGRYRTGNAQISFSSAAVTGTGAVSSSDTEF